MSYLINFSWDSFCVDTAFKQNEVRPHDPCAKWLFRKDIKKQAGNLQNKHTGIRSSDICPHWNKNLGNPFAFIRSLREHLLWSLGSLYQWVSSSNKCSWRHSASLRSVSTFSSTWLIPLKVGFLPCNISNGCGEVSKLLPG